ncbi:MAG: gliding motility-associated C-terminal domain-containing protein [Bacteroidia bacterium]|nr:gliding motility-associated C-terminal domain-containing protein [Bacteroidia bacterium]
MRHKIGLLLLGVGILGAQPQLRHYEVFFRQVYQRANSPSAADSLDIWLFIRIIGSGSLPDTLASSNFPFFYNFSALNFGAARILYRNKFHSDNYYDDLTYTVSGGRVNVTVRRKIGFTPPGDTIASLDTIIGLRVPLYVCGPSVTNPLVWDTLPAAVLNSQLQSLRPRLRWQNDTISLCPRLSAIASFGYSPIPICEGQQVNFSFSFGNANFIIPDSFIVQVERVTPSPSSLVVYPGIVSQMGTGYGFNLIFPSAGTYEVKVIGVDRKCRCSASLGSVSNIFVNSLPPSLVIYGPDSVYGGSVATYTLSQSPPIASWELINGATGSSTAIGSGPSQSITFSSGSVLRVDTIVVSYAFAGNPCTVTVVKPVVVLPCPTSGGSVSAADTELCVGESAVLELTGLPARPDSIRWQKRVDAAWTDITNEGSNPTLPLYITGALSGGTHSYRVKVYYGGCEAYSSDITLNVSGTLLVREFYGLTSPKCPGDTVRMTAAGPGIWVSPNGHGRFVDSLNPSGMYVVSPLDVGQVTICWVIRPEDTTACRDESRDTLCLELTVPPTDAQGAISVSSSRICYGGRVQVEGRITSGAGGFWVSENGSGSFYPNVFSSSAYYVPGINDVGKWINITWVVRGTTCGGVTYKDSVYVEAGSQLRISAPNRVCSGVDFTLSAIPAAENILWFRGSVNSIKASGGFSESNPRFLRRGPSYDAGQLPVGQDTFVAYRREGTCESLDEFPVEVVPSPRAAFEASPRTATMNNPRIRFISQSQGASTYVWDFGDLERLTVEGSQTEVEHVYSAPGTYSVVLYVENNLGCSDFYVCTDCIQILPRRAYLPNAFSPNGDGKNEVFRILPVEEGLRFARLEVFDRWGQVVFAGDNLSEWKGEGKDGKPLDPGTYSYRAVILIPDEGLFTYTGVVHIIR